jgi:hypothetical protein
MEERMNKSYAVLAGVVSLFVLACLVPSKGINAQSTQQTTTQDVEPQMIDGGVNPELIPNSVAYRMYYIAATETTSGWSSAEKSEYLRSFFRLPGASDEDMDTVEAILLDFRSQYDQLIVNFNAQATENLKNAVVTDPSSLTDQFDDLTDKTTKSLSKVFKDKQGSLEAHIQDEKKHMKVTR